MSDLDVLDFSNRDLRNRSFRGKELNGANFSGSDIRGCDFSRAQLVAANFERVRTGRTCRQVLLPILIAGMGAIVAANAITRMVFALLGEIPTSATWLPIVMLHLFLGVAGLGAANRLWLGWNSKFGKGWMHLSGQSSGILIGFFYIGNYAGHNAQVAIVGGLIGAGLVEILSWIARRSTAIFMLVMGAVAAYGFSFLVWTSAVACLTTEQYGWGVCLGALALVYVWFVICALRAAGYELSQLIGTSFRGANLTDAQFDGARLKNTDFSSALGLNYPPG